MDLAPDPLLFLVGKGQTVPPQSIAVLPIIKCETTDGASALSHMAGRGRLPTAPQKLVLLGRRRRKMRRLIAQLNATGQQDGTEEADRQPTNTHLILRLVDHRGNPMLPPMLQNLMPNFESARCMLFGEDLRASER